MNGDDWMIEVKHEVILDGNQIISNIAMENGLFIDDVPS